jgi:MoxR-like ATPase
MAERGRRPPAPGPEGYVESFGAHGFRLDRAAAVSLHLAEALERPLLLEGPPGVGKTEIAKLLARHHDVPLIRLQCYEGLDETKALYEWAYGKQVLYTQLLRGATAALLEGASGLADAVRRLEGEAEALFDERFLLPRPLLRAIRSDRRVVLLVDEVDRADEAFEALLLEVLSDRQVTVPEIGTLAARSVPRVVLTSNDTRDLSDALRRRCLYAVVPYPTFEEELEILALRVPQLDRALADQIVRFVARVRRMDLRKRPGIAETIDWALALLEVGATSLAPSFRDPTLGALLKHRQDIEAVAGSGPGSP